jgi:ABC-type amino acid transport substrate-binding protein
MTFEPQTHSAIISFQDVIDGNFKVLVTKSSSNHELLKTADPTSAMFKYYYDNMEGNSDYFVNSAEQAMVIMLEKENTLLYDSSLVANGDDRFQAIKTTDGIYVTFGWAFKKRSEFTKYFNYHLYQMKQRGVMNKLTKKWKPQVNNSTIHMQWYNMSVVLQTSAPTRLRTG